MKYNVFSIDAWADCCGCDCSVDNPQCWTWNNWHLVDQYDGGLDNDSDILRKFIKPERIDEFHVIDDGYNLVITRIDNQMPIIAIEYGSAY